MARRQKTLRPKGCPLNEVGTTSECQYQKFCKISLAKSDLSISFVVYHTSPNEISVYAKGGRTRSIGCCYFPDGESRISRQLREPLVRLHIYDGHARKRNEFVQNIHLGVLYLQFSDLK